MMQNKVISVISKRPAYRLSGEVRSVLPWLRKKSELLSQSNNEVLEDIIKNCDYRRVVKDDVIVTQGEVGDCFYIMLSGKTSVHIDTRKSDDEAEQTTNVALDEFVRKTHNAHVNAAHDVENTGGKHKPLDRTQYGKFIKHFDAGKSFGELALISDDSVRNATVIADEETDLLIVHRDLFNRSMKAQQEKEFEERKEFIAGCRLFSDWTPKFKHLLEMSIRKEVLPYGTHIMKQGEPLEGLFFIVSGQAKVLTEPSRHKQQFPQLMTTQQSVMEQEFGRHNKENVVRKSITGLTQRQIRVRRKEGYAAAEKRYMSRSLELCTVEGNEIQGDMEVIMEMSTCACTVTCTANTTVFILDTKNYDRLVSKKNLNTIHKLKHGVLRKLQNRIHTTNGSNVSLLKVIHDKLQSELKPRLKEQPNKVKIDNEKQTVLTQMIKLYLKDKGALIDPLLPDSFSARLMSEKRNKEIEKHESKKQERATVIRARRHRVPRSLRQLQSNAVENELMNPEKNWYDQSKPSKDRHIRPKTALGIESRSTMDGAMSPETLPSKSTGVFHLTECEQTDAMGDRIGPKDKPVLVTEEIDHVFQQMENLHREKSEARSKVICSVAAKTELREDAERNRIGYNPDDMYELHHDEDYFDYETSATNLKNLEYRIKSFCDDVRLKRHNDPVRIDELKCFQVKGSDHVPMSGGTVYVNRKPCAYPRNARITADVHQHVRRFIITREQNQYKSSSASLPRPKSAMAITTGSKQRPKSAW